MLKDPKCPLCRGVDTYPVWNFVNYADLIAHLATLEFWKQAHGTPPGIPQIPPAQAEKITAMPGFARERPSSSLPSQSQHRRCSRCHSLLPPEYWESSLSAARYFALTVTGFEQTGKTTWLRGMLNPPESDTYEVIRRTRQLDVTSYEYAEPITVAALREGIRSNIPFVLLGARVRFDTSLTFVRTLDIMGERFHEREPQTIEVITQHLKLRNGPGALLVLDKFKPAVPNDITQQQPSSPVESIASVFQKIFAELRPRPIWTGVVWTHLDQAKWKKGGEEWLSTALPDESSLLIKLANLPLPIPNAPNLEWAEVATLINPKLIWRLAGPILRAAKLDPPIYTGQSKSLSLASLSKLPFLELDAEPLESLISILFRLQIAYSIQAGQHPNGKFDFFFRKEGASIVTGIETIAKALYVASDAFGGGFQSLLKEDPHFTVLPCGLIGNTSVWSDLILVRALSGSGAIK
ncbi:MAG: hypothetical protein ACJ76Y_13800 [Thermoanaerobaculia bacterium]